MVAACLRSVVAEPSWTLSPGLRGQASPHAASPPRGRDGTAAPGERRGEVGTVRRAQPSPQLLTGLRGAAAAGLPSCQPSLPAWPRTHRPQQLQRLQHASAAGRALETRRDHRRETCLRWTGDSGCPCWGERRAGVAELSGAAQSRGDAVWWQGQGSAVQMQG